MADRLTHSAAVCSKVKYTLICIAHLCNYVRLMHSDMDHTVLPANYTMPAFTPQPQSITALWLVITLPSHGGQKAESTWVVGYIPKL